MTQAECLASRQARHPGRQVLAVLALVIARWRSQARDRRMLTMLDQRSLQELGISRAQVEFELSQPFWRPIRAVDSNKPYG